MTTPLRRAQPTTAVADVSQQLSALVDALVELVAARAAESAPAPQRPTARAAYSVKEFCALLGLHYNTVYREIKEGRIKSFRVVGEYRIPHSELERLMAGEVGAA